MRTMFDAIELGMFTATTSASTATQAPALTVESVLGAVAKAEEIARGWEREFNAVALKQGFDLDKGDKMIVPKAFDMTLVPPRYRGSAVYPHDYADNVMFIRGSVFEPYLATPVRRSGPVIRLNGI